MIGSTYRCQCNCVHCCIGSYNINKERELSTDQIKKIINKAYRLGIIKVIFFGGEPILRQDLKVLMEYCSKQGLVTQLDSNGISLTRKKIKEIKKAEYCV